MVGFQLGSAAAGLASPHRALNASRCEHPDCLKARLSQLRACKTEFAQSSQLVRYRKYAKIERTRNDGSTYVEVRRTIPTRQISYALSRTAPHQLTPPHFARYSPI